MYASGFGNGGVPIKTVGDCKYYERCGEVVNKSGQAGEYKCEHTCGYNDSAPTVDPWAPLPNNTRAVGVDGARIGDTIFKVNDFTHITVFGSGVADWMYPSLRMPGDFPPNNAFDWAVGTATGAIQAVRGKEPTGGYAYTPFVTTNRDWCDPVHKGCPGR
jgi:hypothetical protein